MKLYIYSDLHNEFGNLSDKFLCEKDKESIVILAGDIGKGEEGIEWANKTFHSNRVLYIPGNHEYYDNLYPALLQNMKLSNTNSNLTILDNAKILLGNKVFIGVTLWTDFGLFGKNNDFYKYKNELNDFSKIRISPDGIFLTPYYLKILHNRAVDFLKKEVKNHKNQDIVIISHFAPSLKSVSPQYRSSHLTPYFSSNLENFIRRNKNIILWIHGHTHNFNDYYIDNCRIISNCKGYFYESTDFKPDFCVEI